MSEDQRATLLAQAKVAEQAERYEDMVDFMKQIIGMDFSGDELTPEERNLISVGYKNMMATRRSSWRTCQNVEDQAEGGDKDLYAQYRGMVSSEIAKIIDMVVDDAVSKYTKGPLAAKKRENLVFFHKMEGDYYRYGAETSDGDQKEQYKNKADQAYTAAQTAATQTSGNASDETNNEDPLKPTNPILLGLGLNQSVFNYEILQKEQEAKDLAQKHFNDALDQLDALDEGDYKDATLIMQLLKDNLTLWDGPGEEQDDLQVEEM